jgi:hypothetical protein
MDVDRLYQPDRQNVAHLLGGGMSGGLAQVADDRELGAAIGDDRRVWLDLDEIEEPPRWYARVWSRANRLSTARSCGSRLMLALGFAMTAIAVYDLEVRSPWASVEAKLLCAIWAAVWIYLLTETERG